MEPEKQSDSNETETLQCSLVTWDQVDEGWFIAWLDGKTVSAFRFESDEVHRRRTWDDQCRIPCGMLNSWVPDGDGSRLITWPEDTPIDVMKQELIAADCRLW